MKHKNKIINNTSNILNFINTILHILINTITTFMYPSIELFIDVLENILSIFDTKNISINEIMGYVKKTIKASYITNVILLFISELGMIAEVLQGKIVCFDISVLLFYTIIVMIFSVSFVKFLNKYYKVKKFTYFIYFQILFLFPMILVHWIAAIENHDLILMYLNSNQWISIFNTVVLYFSGCLIGIVTLYKNSEQKINHNNQA